MFFESFLQHFLQRARWPEFKRLNFTFVPLMRVISAFGGHGLLEQYSHVPVRRPADTGHRISTSLLQSKRIHGSHKRAMPTF